VYLTDEGNLRGSPRLIPAFRALIGELATEGRPVRSIPGGDDVRDVYAREFIHRMPSLKSRYEAYLAPLKGQHKRGSAFRFALDNTPEGGGDKVHMGPSAPVSYRGRGGSLLKVFPGRQGAGGGGRNGHPQNKCECTHALVLAHSLLLPCVEQLSSGKEVPPESSSAICEALPLSSFAFN